MPLGLENGKIPDKHMRASSAYWNAEPNCCQARFARLNGPGRWLPNLDDPNKWIEIDLVGYYTVTGIVTQGAENWVTHCRVKYEKKAGSGNLVYIKDVEGNIQVIGKALARCFTFALTLRYAVVKVVSWYNIKDIVLQEQNNNNKTKACLVILMSLV